MALTKIITHLVVQFDENRGLVTEYHFVGGSTKARSPSVGGALDLIGLRKTIDDYWFFVDRSIRDKVFEDGERQKTEQFLGELESRGQELANFVFPKSVQADIWKNADETDILLINTNLPDVPWEALYCASAGQNSGFLSRNCIIQRQIESAFIEESVSTDQRAGVLLCVDSALVDEEEQRGEISLRIELQGLNAEVYETTSSRELARRAQDVGVIHWLCEHVTEDGLRLARNTYYSYRDVETHKFPRNSVLFLLSCASARRAYRDTIYSARVSAASGCTVVAPSSVVAVSEALNFIRDIQEITKNHPNLRLSEVWTLLKNPLGGRETEDIFSWRDCYLLWFGIYGDCEQRLS